MNLNCCKCQQGFSNAGALKMHEKSCDVSYAQLENVLELYRSGLSLRKLWSLGYSKIMTKLAIPKSERRTLSEAGKNAQKLYPFKHTEESKRRLSVSASKWLKTKVNHPWRKREETYPEKILREWFEHNVDQKIIREYTPNDFDRNYRMDFAVIDLKIDIEVNGNAHYFKNELKPYYVDRENYIIERGWKVINIHAKAICKDFDSVVNQIKSFLETKNLNFINEIKLQKEVINNDVFNKSQEIIQLIDEGLDNKTIASRLNISGKQLRRFFLAKGIKKLSPCKVNFLKKKKQIFAELAVLDLNEYGLVSKLANKWQTSTTRMSHLIREFKNAK